ncbi:uncharacterized protein B0I36DRAFT_338686 [Microdochium trichocladiopsis]|uniref:Galactose oxidase n=1 Tax=Microdochium trichocladiopsis TaxID=1682393 RepID=A0A9P9BG83_9PEZI|nr:uncharacterized protein B0I36DRAFT_338686 [Microdochium trichocladiopsis]KAH7014414.1 hypothetical protein B0I36DRAFT_338686 [Microdochium trichocladiopsis]
MLFSNALSRTLRLAVIAIGTVPSTTALPQPILTNPTTTTTTTRSAIQPRSQGIWETELHQIPRGPRQGHAVTALGLEVVLLGGTTLSGGKDTTPAPLVEAYAPLTDSWRRLADLPTAMTHTNAASVHGKLYVLGGMTGTKGVLSPTSDSYKFSPFANRWERIPDLPPATRRGAAAVAAWKDMIVVAGGVKHLNIFTGAQTTSNKVSAYNTITKAWLAYPDLPDGGRDHAGGAVWNNTFYLVGGRMGGRSNVKADVFALDLKTPEAGWKKKASMPTARGAFALVELNDKLYAFGGEVSKGDRDAQTEAFGSIEVYDPQTDEWEVLDEMPLPRHSTGAGVVLGEIYIPGGADAVGPGTATKTMQGYMPGGRVNGEL